MKRALLALLLLAACAGPQVIPPEKPAEGQPERPERPSERPERPPQPTVIIEDGMRLEYRPHGRTVIEVTEPEGTQVQAFDGPALVAADTAPVAFDALPDHYYRMVFQLPSGAVREKKLQARTNELLTVRLMEAKGPRAMTEKDFHILRTALEQYAAELAQNDDRVLDVHLDCRLQAERPAPRAAIRTDVSLPDLLQPIAITVLVAGVKR